MNCEIGVNMKAGVTVNRRHVKIMKTARDASLPAFRIFLLPVARFPSLTLLFNDRSAL